MYNIQQVFNFNKHRYSLSHKQRDVHHFIEEILSIKYFAIVCRDEIGSKLNRKFYIHFYE